MFKWLAHLFRHRNAALHGGLPLGGLPLGGLPLGGLPLGGLPARSFPTLATISGWDDQGLYVATGCESAIRHHTDGFQTLNDVERALCCFYLLESDINNGGAGKWIDSLCPSSAAETPRALQEIGATEMANFVTDVLRPPGDTSQIPSKHAWVDHYLSMPDNAHEHWETLTPKYLELEDTFLKLAYAYARKNWQQVRAA